MGILARFWLVDDVDSDQADYFNLEAIRHKIDSQCLCVVDMA